MLKCNLQLAKNSTSDKLDLNDFYISPDLSVISGTTTDINLALKSGDRVMVKSTYFPDTTICKVKSFDVVKRNGYVLYPKAVEIKEYKYFSSYNNSEESGQYIEHNGNCYFIVNNEMVVDGISYSVDFSKDKTTILDKAYIEDNQLIIDGINYQVTFDDFFKNIALSDMTGVPYPIPETWDTSHIQLNYTTVNKIVIERPQSQTYNCENIFQCGYRPYVEYQEEKYYLKDLYNNNGFYNGVGVTINGIKYYWVESDVVINYHMIPSNEIQTIRINGDDFIVRYEFGECDNSNLLSLVMAEENLPIMLGEKIQIQTLNTVDYLDLDKDDDGNPYLMMNSTKYTPQKGLCDSVVLGNKQYYITYDGDVTNPQIGLICHIELDNGVLQYFKVNAVKDGEVVSLKKVEAVNGVYEESYIVTQVNNKKVYTNDYIYMVTPQSGVKVGDDIYPLTKKVITQDGFVIDTIYYIEYGKSVNYEVTVLQVVGSNQFICEPYVAPMAMNIEEVYQYTNNMVYILSSEPSLVYKNDASFGLTPLQPQYWIDMFSNEIITSLYEVANVKENIEVYHESSNFSIPITLNKPVDHTFNQYDYITNTLFDRVEESNVNDITDMEKDIYQPVADDNSDKLISDIQFNLHFRTRDLENWQIIDDKGLNSAGELLSYDYMFSNWFITDYYPYNHIIKNIDTYPSNTLDDLFSRSDLLGFAYFTDYDLSQTSKKLVNSFLRLSIYDSMDSGNQNLLATSTIHLNIGDLISKANTKVDEQYYFDCKQSLNNDWYGGTNGENKIKLFSHKPKVMSECFVKDELEDYLHGDNLFNISSGDVRLSSQLNLSNNLKSGFCNEGYYAYILKYFTKKNKKQRVYLKCDFYHAGLGIKIPMMIPNDVDNHAIVTWDKAKLDKFKEGYALNDLNHRLYIPLDIYYSKKMRKLVYTIASENNYNQAITHGNQWRFNLFEPKYQVM